MSWAELAIFPRNGAGPMNLGREYQGGWACWQLKNPGAKIQASRAKPRRRGKRLAGVGEFRDLRQLSLIHGARL